MQRVTHSLYIDSEQRAAIKQALGQDYKDFIEWRLRSHKAELDRWFEVVTPDQFAKKLESLDLNDLKSIHDFSNFLNRPKIKPITIGTINRKAVLQIAPESGQLEPHPTEEEDESATGDRRGLLASLILGL